MKFITRLMVLLIWCHSCAQQEQEETRRTDRQVALQHLIKANELVEQLRFRRAETELQSVLRFLAQHDPLQTEANDLMKKIKFELSCQRAIEEAKDTWCPWDTRLKLLGDIPPQSAFYQEAQTTLSDFIRRMSRYHMNEGRSYFRAKHYERAHKHLTRYMKLNPCDHATYKSRILPAEKKMRRLDIPFTPFIYDCQYPRDAKNAAP